MGTTAQSSGRKELGALEFPHLPEGRAGPLPSTLSLPETQPDETL